MAIATSARAEPGAAPRWRLGTRLLQRLLPAIGLLWLLSAVLVLGIALIEGQRAVDRSLARAAKLFLAYAEHEFREKDNDLEEIVQSERLNASGYRVQMWGSDGRLLIKSSAAPIEHMATIDAGFEDVQLDGAGWRVFVIDDSSGKVRLEVAEDETGRSAAVRRLVLSLVVPVLLGAPLLGALVWFALRRALWPVAAAAQDVATRAPADLGPIASDRLPGELAPLVEAFNALLQRVEHSVESERRFTADAAHELRTPLAAIRLQAQLAQRAGTPEQAAQALQRLIAGVDRATRLINQLLTLARFDPDDALALGEEAAPLTAVVEGVVEELAPSAEARHVRLAFDADGDLPEVPAQAVHVLLRNLVENAIRHSPEGGAVRIVTGATPTAWTLGVEDEGPGIPPEARERVFERFVSLQRGQGSGLGLSIVRRIVQLLGARIEIGAAGDHGARVLVSVPRAA